MQRQGGPCFTAHGWWLAQRSCSVRHSLDGSGLHGAAKVPCSGAGPLCGVIAEHCKKVLRGGRGTAERLLGLESKQAAETNGCLRGLTKRARASLLGSM